MWTLLKKGVQNIDNDNWFDPTQSWQTMVLSQYPSYIAILLVHNPPKIRMLEKKFLDVKLPNLSILWHISSRLVKYLSNESKTTKFGGCSWPCVFLIIRMICSVFWFPHVATLTALHKWIISVHLCESFLGFYVFGKTISVGSFFRVFSITQVKTEQTERTKTQSFVEDPCPSRCSLHTNWCRYGVAFGCSTLSSSSLLDLRFRELGTKVFSKRHQRSVHWVPPILLKPFGGGDTFCILMCVFSCHG